ncbi:MAG: hypothetical protein HN350_13015 [Phycisphaerales bacterium]|jgi:hypothetical protein|nr:hypothetical protein [Phycisphaerales bacterium]
MSSANHRKKLIEEYVVAAEEYGRCIQDGNPKGADKCVDVIEGAFVDIKAIGKEGFDELSSLLELDDESVRLWASSHLLNYPEYNSLSVLEKIKNSTTILALTAEVTLDQWRNGKVNY